jgi:hypothetical protein
METVRALRAKGVPVSTIPESAVAYSLGKADRVQANELVALCYHVEWFSNSLGKKTDLVGSHARVWKQSVL